VSQEGNGLVLDDHPRVKRCEVPLLSLGLYVHYS